MFQVSNYLGFLFVFVFLFIGIEFLYSIYSKKGKIFRAENSIVNISMGLFDRFVALYLSVNVIMIYQYIQEHFGLFTFNTSSVWTWVFVFFLYDFSWYVYHILGHRVNLFWAAHVVHHQSEDYNFTVSLAITPLQYIVKFTVWLFIPLLGVPIDILFIVFSLNSLYQFFLHTRYIRSNKWVEYVFITPSLHRVHHGSNPQYLDKNYGAMLSIWDRLFGTFQKEEEPVVYGLTKSVHKRTFENLFFHSFIDLRKKMKQLSGVKNKMLLMVKSPDWSPTDTQFIESDIYEARNSYAYNISSITKIYCAINLLLSVIAMSFVAFYFHHINLLSHVLLFLFFTCTFLLIGYRIEKVNYWKKVELLRITIFTFLLLSLVYRM